MNVIGIVVEYNPFHYGHLHHIEEIKKKFPQSIIIACLSTNYNERGEVSIIPKWEKAFLALSYGVDLVVELPYVFSSQAADVFSHGALSILNHLKVDTIVFGSESNDVDKLYEMAKFNSNEEHNLKIKDYLSKGNNYPTSVSLSLNDFNFDKVSTPNDLLGICYIKEIINNNYNITPYTIRRTNNYHDINLSDKITSATSIRLAKKDNKDVSNYVPELTNEKLKGDLFFNDYYFELLKYKILTSKDLSIYHTVNEGIEYKLKKEIVDSKNIDEFILRVKSKRYTYNRISRMLTHILVDYTKEEASLTKEVEYIRVLGFNDKGKNHLKNVRKELSVPIITKYMKNKYLALDIEYRATICYSYPLSFDKKKEMIESEYKNKPLQF